MAPLGRYDIYDDTGRSSRRSAQRERERAASRRANQDDYLSPRRRAERRSRASANGGEGARYGVLDGGLSLFEQFDRDMSAFQDSVFGGIFGGGPEAGGTPRDRSHRHSFFGDLRPFESAHNNNNGNNNGGFSSYMYESHTETMGPDGVVRRETVRSKPGVDGRPTTERIIHDGATGRSAHTRTRDAPARNVFDDMFGILGPNYGGGMFNIRDVTEEEDARNRNNTTSRRMRERFHRRRNERAPQIIVEEPDEVDDGTLKNDENSNRNRNSHSNTPNYRRRRSSSSRDGQREQRKSFLDRARDWDWRAGRRS